MTTKLPFLSDEHHYALANVAARASQLDHHIEYAISLTLSEQPKIAEYLLKNLSPDRIVGLLRAVLLDTLPDHETQIESLVAEIRRVRSERNDLLHWIWGKAESEDTAIQAAARPFRERRIVKRKASEIQKIADDMLQLATTLAAWQTIITENQIQTLHERLAQLTPPANSA